MSKVTAGRDALGEFAPEFAHLNDDILFGEVWAREQKLSKRDRSLITVSALMASGILDSSLKYHISHAKENGVTKEEMAEAITPSCLLRRLAEGLGRLQYGKGNLLGRQISLRFCL